MNKLILSATLILSNAVFAETIMIERTTNVGFKQTEFLHRVREKLTLNVTSIPPELNVLAASAYQTLKPKNGRAPSSRCAAGTFNLSIGSKKESACLEGKRGEEIGKAIAYLHKLADFSQATK